MIGKRELISYFVAKSSTKRRFDPHYLVKRLPGSAAGEAICADPDPDVADADADADPAEAEEAPAKRKKVATFEELSLAASNHSLLALPPPALPAQAAQSLLKIPVRGNIKLEKLQVFAAILDHAQKAWAHRPSGAPKLLLVDMAESQWRCVKVYANELPSCKPKSVFLAYSSAQIFRVVHQVEVLQMKGYNAEDIRISLMSPSCQASAVSRTTTLPFALAMLAACSAMAKDWTPP